MQLQRVFEDFKVLADKKKEIYDSDIEALIKGRTRDSLSNNALWEIVAVNTSAGTGTMPTAAVCLKHADGHRVQEAACGDGPLDAVFHAIEKITGVTLRLRDYHLRSVSVGKDSLGEANVEAEYEGQTHRGRGVSTDIIEASAIAFLNVVNRVLAMTAVETSAVVESEVKTEAKVAP
jgi:2-isopropylmalate synthase